MQGTPTYNDRLFKWGAAFIGAYLISEFGGEDGYFSLDRLLSKEFLIEYGSSAFIALVLVEIVAWVTHFLDRQCGWSEHAVLRTIFQLLLGVVVPSLVDLSLASTYFLAFGTNIWDTNYIRYALLPIVAFIALFNTCYIMRRFILQSIAKDPLNNNAEPQERFIIASRGLASYPIPLRDIAYIYRHLDQTYLCTLERTEYLLSKSLYSIERSLPLSFFRVNRQLIMNFNTLKSFKSIGDRKIILTLEPPPPHGIATDVSRLKVSPFKTRLQDLEETGSE